MARRTEKINIVVGAKDQTKGVLKSIKKNIVGIGAAYLGWQGVRVVGEQIVAAADYEKVIISLESVVAATGRNINEVYAEMNKQIGGLASKASVATGFLKGMTTELSVLQIAEMTQAVKEASIAMGEDFNTQLPLIIRAVKQLNPAILDNIGVTVRLDKINKQIKDGLFDTMKGYEGLGNEVNEATQQNAIFLEIIKQTQKFQGQEAALLGTTAGQMQQLAAATADLGVEFGSIFIELGLPGLIGGITTATRGLTGVFEDVRESVAEFIGDAEEGLTAVDLLLKKVAEGDGKDFGEAVADIFLTAGESVVDATLFMGGGLKDIVDILSDGFIAFNKAGIAATDFAINLDFVEVIDGISRALIAYKKNLGKSTEKTGEASESVEDITEAIVVLANTFEIIPDEPFDDLFAADEIRATAEAMRDLNRASQEADAIVQAQEDSDRLLFNVRLDLLSEYEAEKAIIEQEAQDRTLAARLAVIAGAEEDTQLLIDIETAKNQQLADLNANQQQLLAEEWLNRWSFISESMETIVQDMALTAITNASDMKDAMRKTFAAIGQSMVRELVGRGVKALFSMIATTVVATKAQTTQVVVTKALAVATGAVAVASGAATIAMGVELAAVVLLTKGYIALASAMAAASLGATSAESIAAATSTKASLTAILTGFDDPRNDAAAFRHGADYAQHFMSGTQTVFGAPEFGRQVSRAFGSNDLARSEFPELGGGGAREIHLHFHGPVTDESFIRETIVPAIEESSIEGFSDVIVDQDNLTGSREIGIA